jgi:hypothetical protein
MNGFATSFFHGRAGLQRLAGGSAQASAEWVKTSARHAIGRSRPWLPLNFKAFGAACVVDDPSGWILAAAARATSRGRVAHPNTLLPHGHHRNTVLGESLARC